jgi:hypothetical protein
MLTLGTAVSADYRISSNTIAGFAMAGDIVNRRSNLTPYRRPILTPLGGGF